MLCGDCGMGEPLDFLKTPADGCASIRGIMIRESSVGVGVSRLSRVPETFSNKKAQWNEKSEIGTANLKI